MAKKKPTTEPSELEIELVASLDTADRQALARALRDAVPGLKITHRATHFRPNPRIVEAVLLSVGDAAGKAFVALLVAEVWVWAKKRFSKDEKRLEIEARNENTGDELKRLTRETKAKPKTTVTRKRKAKAKAKTKTKPKKKRTVPKRYRVSAVS